MNVHLDWIKCDNGNWCNFFNVNLGHEHFNNMEGVYVIRYSGQNPTTLYVGQGVIKERIAKHREEATFLAYPRESVYVTWASVPIAYRSGIEQYLAIMLNPKVGERHPDITPIVVNLPWGE